MVTEILAARPTEVAVAAGNHRIKGDTRAVGKVIDIGPGGHDEAGSFVPHHQRRNPASRAAVVAVNIASADPARFYLHQHIVGTQLRFFDVGDLHLLVLGQQEGFHEGLS